MTKRKTVALTEAWWVWLGEAGAIRVGSEPEALALMRTQGREFTVKNQNGRGDMAAPVAELLWNEPLPENELMHKTVVSPVNVIVHNGELRMILTKFSARKLKSIEKDWGQLEPLLPAWLPLHYSTALKNPEVLLLSGRKSLLEQLNLRWPSTTLSAA